jgi:hypothetical protein
MSRDHIKSEILNCLQNNDLPGDETTVKIAELSIDCTLNYLTKFIGTLSHELVSDGLYSHSMVTGLVLKKIRDLRDGN